MTDQNKPTTELGATADEFSQSAETTANSEIISPTEFVATQEIIAASEIPAKNKKKASKGTAKIASALIAAAGAITLGVGLATPIQQAITPTAQVQLKEFGGDSSSVFYHLEIDQEGYDVVLYNDFVTYTQPLEQGTNGGVFEDLTYGVKYTFAVQKDGKLSKTQALTRQIVLKHPVEYADVSTPEIGEEFTEQGSTIYIETVVYSDVPLTIVVTDGKGYKQEKPLTPDETAIAFVDFEGLKHNTTYTIQIVGNGIANKKHVVLTQTYTTADPNQTTP